MKKCFCKYVLHRFNGNGIHFDQMEANSNCKLLDSGKKPTPFNNVTNPTKPYQDLFDSTAPKTLNLNRYLLTSILGFVKNFGSSWKGWQICNHKRRGKQNGPWQWWHYLYRQNWRLPGLISWIRSIQQYY